MDYQIVKCKDEHLSALTDFYAKVIDYLDRTVNYPKWTAGVYPGKESIRQDISDGGQYMCIQGETIVGAFVLNDDPRGDYSKGEWRNSLNIGEYMVIHTLAVSPDHYGKGIGGQIVAFCIAKAKADGYKAIRIDVVPDNTPARRLYEKAGFTFAGEKDLMRNIKEIPIFALYEMNFNMESV